MKQLLSLLIFLSAISYSFAQGTVKEVYEKWNKKEKIEYEVFIEDKENGCFSITHEMMDDGCEGKTTYAITSMKLEKDHIELDVRLNDANKTSYIVHYSIGDKYHELIFTTAKGDKEVKKLKPKGQK